MSKEISKTSRPFLFSSEGRKLKILSYFTFYILFFIFIISRFFFYLPEETKVVILRSGLQVRYKEKSGIYFKWPFFEQLAYFKKYENYKFQYFNLVFSIEVTDTFIFHFKYNKPFDFLDFLIEKNFRFFNFLNPKDREKFKNLLNLSLKENSMGYKIISVNELNHGYLR